jgi:uncharacterized surface protein with fasciclin (FAS1) repeats
MKIEMKNYFKKSFYRPDKLLILLVLGLTILASCTSDYYYDKKAPTWLGASIYDYLKSDGHFTNYVKLIDDLGYTEVLRLTGSKTLFVANDSAFVEFYKSNDWNVKGYSSFTLAQKKMLLNFSMINNAYLMQTLSNYYSAGTAYEGTAMRRATALSALDSIPFDQGSSVSTSKYWDNYRVKGIHVLKDNSSYPLVYFTPQFLQKSAFTAADFSILTGGATRGSDDVYVFNDKIIKRDITCKNGYVHVLQSVLVPHTNMAQYIQNNPSTKIFSKLIDRFCGPYYDASNTILYRQLHPEFTDSIFVKHYFATNGGATFIDDGSTVGGAVYLPTNSTTKTPALNLLPFDPGWNSYRSAALQADMAAMFVPTDDAMNSYFKSDIGAILKNRFRTWDSVPDEIVLPFLKRHMRVSMIESVPSRFSKMVDAENYALPVNTGQIQSSYTAVNGEVFVTNAVYPPVDYISVYSPVLLSANSKIMNWAINISQTSVDGTKFAFYKLYLNSLVSTYSLFIPTDDYLNNYIDPIAYSQDKQGVLKFKFNAKTSSVTALVYLYNKTTGDVGTDPIDSITSITNPGFIQNRLWNLLDSHIVVGSVETGDSYFITKANDFIKVSGSGNSMSVQGGQDIVNNTSAQVTNAFNQTNGKTYFLNKPISSSLKSVYKILSQTPEFSMFYNLLNGVPDTCITQIFAQQGMDYRINFFNAFRYTVYVPTNTAIQNAITAGTITPWETIYALPNPQKGIAINKMVQFLKYHFQDNAVFFGQPVNDQYQSATIKNDNNLTYWGTAKNKYYKLGVVATGSSITITMDSKAGDLPRTAKVLTSDPLTSKPLYNIIAKDYIFDKLPTLYKNVDGTGSASGALFNTSNIVTSASSVIHEIDNVLTFE